VLLRLMAAYYGQGRHQEAVQAMQLLNELTGDGKFVDAVREATASTDSSPLEVCRAMYERASEGEENHRRFNSDIDDYLQYNGYPIWGDPDPRKVCPYSELTYDNMLNVRVSANIPPAEAYAAVGFMLEVAQAANVDRDSEEEWVAVYQGNLYFLDNVHGKWSAELIRQIYDTPTVIRLGVADVTGDQVSDLLIMITGSEPHFQAFASGPDPVPCGAGQISHTFIRVDLTTTSYRRVEHQYISCRSAPLPDLTTVEGVSEFRYPFSWYSDSRADWPQWRFMVGMPGRPDTYQNIYEYIDDIVDNILTGTDLEASRQALRTLIAYIPPADTEAAFIVPRLHYLLGLSFEIEGRADDAVEAYLALIQSAPQSAWSWLAWTRLAVP
jgi:tetratricopeptide (TPR) repeat protein